MATGAGVSPNTTRTGPASPDGVQPPGSSRSRALSPSSLPARTAPRGSGVGRSAQPTPSAKQKHHVRASLTAGLPAWLNSGRGRVAVYTQVGELLPPHPRPLAPEAGERGGRTPPPSVEQP